MRVAIFGVGYVGCVSAACLAMAGHDVIGVDVDPYKVQTINEGISPFFEPGLDELIREMVAAGKLRATTSHAEAVKESEIGIVCVGTPTQPNGSTRMDYLRHVMASIGDELRKKDGYFVLALRSTVLAKAIEQDLLPLLEGHSGKSLGDKLGFVYNPEFLREGAALKDFRDAPWTIIGSSDRKAGDTVAGLYQHLKSPIVRTDVRTATMVKYLCNAFHALKVVFGNEVGSLCRDMGVDGNAVMDIFCQDTKLNISPRYLKPGFAFGGSCLPKDLKALVYELGRRGLKAPVLESILTSNEVHLTNCIRTVVNAGRSRIGLVGLSFKEGTDDLRESPAVELAERLIGKGFDVRVYDPSITPGRLHGSNLSFIERSIPHIWKLLVHNLDELMDHAETVVVMQHIRAEDLAAFGAMSADQICIDMVRTLSPEIVSGKYQAMDLPQQEESSVLPWPPARGEGEAVLAPSPARAVQDPGPKVGYGNER